MCGSVVLVHPSTFWMVMLEEVLRTPDVLALQSLQARIREPYNSVRGI